MQVSPPHTADQSIYRTIRLEEPHTAEHNTYRTIRLEEPHTAEQNTYRTIRLEEPHTAEHNTYRTIRLEEPHTAEHNTYRTIRLEPQHTAGEQSGYRTLRIEEPATSSAEQSMYRALRLDEPLARTVRLASDDALGRTVLYTYTGWRKKKIFYLQTHTSHQMFHISSKHSILFTFDLLINIIVFFKLIFRSGHLHTGEFVNGAAAEDHLLLPLLPHTLLLLLLPTLLRLVPAPDYNFRR
jgi:hypothetical protein